MPQVHPRWRRSVVRLASFIVATTVTITGLAGPGSDTTEQTTAPERVPAADAAPVATPVATQSASLRFADVRAPHADAIHALAAAGVTEGCAPQQFCPDLPVSRAQLASLLARALDLPAAGPAGFSDVGRDSTHADGIARAAAAGVVEGYPDGRFVPGASVNRAQSASMLTRALDLEPVRTASFGDIAHSTHRNAIEALAAAGVSQGCAAGVFCPGQVLTRAQSASLLARALGLVEPDRTPLPTQPTPPAPSPGPSPDPSDETREPAPAGSRQALLAEREGFGRNAGAGSEDFEEVVVTTLADSGSGSLRAALSSGQRWIRFQPGLEGTIDVGSTLRVPSDVVIDGRGANITLNGGSSTTILSLTNVDNVIVNDLTFRGGYDQIQIYRGTTNVWIHHISATRAADEILGITGEGDRPDLITVSWSRFENADKVMLLSGSEYDRGHSSDRVTIHHNWFHRNRQRQPLVRFSRVHYYNNWVSEWGESGTGQAVRVGNDGRLISQANVFDDVHGRPAIIPEDMGTHGYVRSEGDVTTGNPEIQERGPEQVFDPSEFYDYQLDTAGEALRAMLRAEAGAR